jgi:hypothetical protein
MRNCVRCLGLYHRLSSARLHSFHSWSYGLNFVAVAVPVSRRKMPKTTDDELRPGHLAGGLADRAIGRELCGFGIDGRPPASGEQWNYTARIITSVRVVTPAVSKDQRRLAQQLVCHHVSPRDLCNKFSESNAKPCHLSHAVSLILPNRGPVLHRPRTSIPDRRVSASCRSSKHRRAIARTALGSRTRNSPSKSYSIPGSQHEPAYPSVRSCELAACRTEV